MHNAFTPTKGNNLTLLIITAIAAGLIIFFVIQKTQNMPSTSAGAQTASPVTTVGTLNSASAE